MHAHIKHTRTQRGHTRSAMEGMMYIFNLMPLLTWAVNLQKIHPHTLRPHSFLRPWIHAVHPCIIHSSIHPCIIHPSVRPSIHHISPGVIAVHPGCHPSCAIYSSISPVLFIDFGAVSYSRLIVARFVSTNPFSILPSIHHSFHFFLH